MYLTFENFDEFAVSDIDNSEYNFFPLLGVYLTSISLSKQEDCTEIGLKG
jgi:hypothetical protein